MSSSGQDSDGGFYKGLFFGAMISLGLIWFLGTKEGKKVKKQLTDKGEVFLEKARESLDEALADEFIEDNPKPFDQSNESEQPIQRFFEEK